MLKRKYARSERHEAGPAAGGILRAGLGRALGSVHVLDFGTNPGALRMCVYQPHSLLARAPLVVVLHDSSERAGISAIEAAWRELADEHGFALLFPEQSSLNNSDCAFNWFLPGDTKRDRGEAGSIRQMTAYLLDQGQFDSDRIFVTGFGTGGGMACALLAAYPDLFAAGAVLGGMPYGAAINLDQARANAQQPRSRPPREWAYLVRSASQHKGPWPRISVWHGTADEAIHPANSAEIVKQWTELHGLPLYPSEARITQSHEHRIWREPGGEILVESHSMVGAALLTPADAELPINMPARVGQFWGLMQPPGT